jgi:transport and Golgi organization protein 2
MCTLSWLSDETGGYFVWFNRDEQKSRALARLPSLEERGGLQVITPLDPDFGGTWIGVNEKGIAFCLANRYTGNSTSVPAPGDRISRGLLLASILDASSRREATDRIAAMELRRFQPFTVAGFEPGSPVLLLSWDGRHLGSVEHEAQGLVLTSSGLDQARAESSRRDVFETALREAGAYGPDLMRQIHRGHLPERGSTSVCMHREDAETVSLSEIRVEPGRVTFSYVAGSPCQIARPAVVSMRGPRIED